MIVDAFRIKARTSAFLRERMMEHGVPQYLDAELLEKFAEVKREQLDRNADYKLPNYQQYE